MVNNINKTKNHLLPQLELVEHSKRQKTYDIGRPGYGLRQAQTCGRIHVRE
jgi:hypothetical protein